jgi:hypothetical protein
MDHLVHTQLFEEAHARLSEMLRRRLTMTQNKYHAQEERELVIDIEDCLIELYVAQKEAIQDGDRCRAIELEFEIRELRRDRDRIKHWAVV